jgi:hypothetical protein
MDGVLHVIREKLTSAPFLSPSPQGGRKRTGQVNNLAVKRDGAP